MGRFVDLRREDLLKIEILKQYPSIALFLRHAGYTGHKDIATVANKVDDYLHVCEILDVDPFTLERMNSYEPAGVSITENRLLHGYMKLNKNGRKVLMEMLDDLGEMGKYRRNS